MGAGGDGAVDYPGGVGEGRGGEGWELKVKRRELGVEGTVWTDALQEGKEYAPSAVAEKTTVLWTVVLVSGRRPAHPYLRLPTFDLRLPWAQTAASCGRTPRTVCRT